MLNGTPDGEVKAFGGTGGEDDISGGSTYQVGDMAGGGFDGGFGAIAHLMINAAGIAKVGGHGLQNLFSHSWVNGGSGVVVEVNHRGKS